MIPGTLVLLHSPLLGAAGWGHLPDELTALGHAPLVIDVTDDVGPPYAASYVARAAQQIRAAAPPAPLVLIGHSGAGPLLAQVGYSQRAARRAVGGYVFLDAGLLRARASRLDLMRTEDADLAAELEAQLTAGARFPDWSDDDLRGALEHAADRALVRAAIRPRDLAFFTETLPHPDDWPDAPCGYLRTSGAYVAPARTATARGWVVDEYDAGHFAALADPAQLALRFLALIERL